MEKFNANVKEIKSSARKILQTPLPEFLSSDYMNIIKGHLKSEGEDDLLIEIIDSTYDISELCTKEDFALCSEKTAQELNELYLVVIKNIQSLKSFNSHSSKDPKKLAIDLFRTIRTDFYNLEGTLPKKIYIKLKAIPDMKLFLGNDNVGPRDIYSEVDRKRINRSINLIVANQLDIPIEEILNTACIKVSIKQFENKSNANQLSSGIISEEINKSYEILKNIPSSPLTLLSIEDFQTVVRETDELITTFQLIKASEFHSDYEFLLRIIKSLLEPLTNKIGHWQK